ncbi:MAG: glycosyl transferase family 2 [Proteobacteria bacterium]|nr:glycosyl transferase family 2 [Pseudomonadota bacterium]|tara:strand:- start:66 stop:875 length:810 start_codon:yes stop_codon:yes gene_type:complete
MKIAVILTTYNRPDMLERVLEGYSQQSDRHFELIVADDGSTSDTNMLLKGIKSAVDFPIRHCWQDDNGFRAAKIRNKAVNMSNAEYLIFSDGDCIPHFRFVETHRRFAETGFFLSGNRILLSEIFTKKVIQSGINLNNFNFNKWIKSYISGDINRLTPLVFFPDTSLRKIKLKKWIGVKTCNLSLWKKDFQQVNGLDESYQGWGLEDSDLIVRLINSKIFNKSVKFAAPVFHLWHPQNSKNQIKKNLSQLNNTIKERRIRAVKGIEQYE